MKIIELHFSDTVKDFHTWCRNHNKKSVLVIQSIYDLTSALEVHEKINHNDNLEFIGEDLRIRLSVKKVYMPNNTTLYILSHYYNIQDNFMYLSPSMWYDIDEIFLLKF